jgi:hypothetical protein
VNSLQKSSTIQKISVILSLVSKLIFILLFCCKSNIKVIKK